MWNQAKNSMKRLKRPTSVFLHWKSVSSFLTTDISEYKCKVDAFEVSSKGFLTSRNHTTLATLHKFINPAIKLSVFKKNISALSLTASYHIFNCKSEPTFVEPPFLLPPIKI